MNEFLMILCCKSSNNPNTPPKKKPKYFKNCFSIVYKTAPAANFFALARHARMLTEQRSVLRRGAHRADRPSAAAVI